MTNLILLLGFAIGVAGLAALGIMAGLKWITQNPTILVGIAIGAVIAIAVTIKVRNASDEVLVKRYRRSQEYEDDKPEPERPVKKTVAEPVTAQTSIDDLAEALVRMGYAKTESKDVLKDIFKEMPKASDTEVITVAMHRLSVEAIR